jgi:hypothetical protein
MSGHAGACRVDTQRSREKSLSRVGVGEIGRARERVASGVLFIDFYLSWMSPDCPRIRNTFLGGDENESKA